MNIIAGYGNPEKSLKSSKFFVFVGWYGDLYPWAVSFDLRVFFKECVVLLGTPTSLNPWGVLIASLPRLRQSVGWPEGWEFVVECRSNKLHQQNGSKMMFISCLCFLKENSKPKVWIQFWTRSSALILLSFDFPQGTVLLLWWSESLSLRKIHELATLKTTASSPVIRLPQGVNELLVLGRASEVC